MITERIEMSHLKVGGGTGLQLQLNTINQHSSALPNILPAISQGM